MKKIVMLIVTALVMVNVAYAGIYKWRDTNGTLHFGDQPPVGVKFGVLGELADVDDNLVGITYNKPLEVVQENIPDVKSPEQEKQEKQEKQERINALTEKYWRCFREDAYPCLYRGITSFEIKDGKLTNEIRYGDGSVSRNEILSEDGYFSFREKGNGHGEYYMFIRDCKVLGVYGNNGLIFKMKQPGVY